MCISFPVKNTDKHDEMDAYGKSNDVTVVYAPWHPNPEYRMFKTNSLLSRNDEYPSGLVIFERTGPVSWSKYKNSNG